MQFKARSLRAIADMVCGNVDYFPYRSSSYITEFFEDCDLEFVHDGSTRWAWVADRLAELLAEPQPAPNALPDGFMRVIRALLDKGEAQEGDEDRSRALAALNVPLAREGFEAFLDEHGAAHVRHIVTNTLSAAASPHRPFTPAEVKMREQLASYLHTCSEDELIEEVLLPLFRQLGFQRITAAGHKDRALEYGKDLWMKFTLPTLHVIYFGLQVKKGKIDAAGASKARSVNVAEVHQQALMMLGHEIFDPEIGKRVLVDHAIIVAGGEITKQAKNWIGERLDASKRAQIMFLDRDDILNLFVTNSLALPAGALPQSESEAEFIPF